MFVRCVIAQRDAPLAVKHPLSKAVRCAKEWLAMVIPLNTASAHAPIEGHFFACSR